MGQKAGHRVAQLGSMLRISQGQREGVGRPEVLSGGGSASRFVQVVGRLQFCVVGGCWPEAPRTSIPQPGTVNSLCLSPFAFLSCLISLTPSFLFHFSELM